MNRLERIFKQSQGEVDYLKGYTLYLNDLLKHLDFNAVRDVINCFLDARKNKKTIFFAGKTEGAQQQHPILPKTLQRYVKKPGVYVSEP